MKSTIVQFPWLVATDGLVNLQPTVLINAFSSAQTLGDCLSPCALRITLRNLTSEHPP